LKYVQNLKNKLLLEKRYYSSIGL
jgi:hypothetical protein